MAGLSTHVDSPSTVVDSWSFGLWNVPKKLMISINYSTFHD